jgi:hypothetical protein
LFVLANANQLRMATSNKIRIEKPIILAKNMNPDQIKIGIRINKPAKSGSQK